MRKNNAWDSQSYGYNYAYLGNPVHGYDPCPFGRPGCTNYYNTARRHEINSPATMIVLGEGGREGGNWSCIVGRTGTRYPGGAYQLGIPHNGTAKGWFPVTNVPGGYWYYLDGRVNIAWVDGHTSLDTYQLVQPVAYWDGR